MPDPISSEEIHRLVDGQTLPKAFLAATRAHADRVALRWKQADGSFGEWTFGDYAENVARVAGGLSALGVGHGDRVVLMLRNIPEFHILDLAANMVGATSISIYNSSSPEQVHYLADHSEAKLAFVEDAGFLIRFLEVRDRLPGLQQLGVLRDPEGAAPGDVFGADALFGANPIDLEESAQVAQPDDLATMIYTSGTTGPPKGVMLTQRNVAWTVESFRRALELDDLPGKRVVSYLPMAHIAERMVSHYQQIFFALEVTSCPDPGAIAEYLRTVRPNILFGVPRVWEKLYAGIHAALAVDADKQRSFAEAVETASPIVEAMTWDRATEEQTKTYEFLDEVAFRNVRKLVGLDALDLAMTGAAPIPPEMLGWFRTIGVPLAELYGLSECSGPMTCSAQRPKVGSVGPAIPGCEVKLADDGEIICRGGNVFQGYLKNPEKTAEALDDEGWLHSGDIGTVDEDGYFRIVDRKKELIITAGGKNISPANLEAALKMIPLVGQACAIGDRRPFVSALVVLDPDAARTFATSEGLGEAGLSELANHPKVIESIQGGLEDAMADFNNAERVKKVKVLGEEWLPDSECLTPTSKLKRRGIHQRYAAEIEALYER